MFVPINVKSKNHWTLAVVYFQKKTIRYYDSMAYPTRPEENCTSSCSICEDLCKSDGDDSEWNQLPFREDHFKDNHSHDDSQHTAVSFCYLLLWYLEQTATLGNTNKNPGFNRSEWKIHATEYGTPQQNNYVDCGVFTMMNAYDLSVNKVRITFSIYASTIIV
jgi:hypothetical protein